ncbi:MAG: hypothetical protein QF845_03350 [Candidatus Marinimicrobia bacterium]|nr:hypothetical protein [Candidatus Neomarinimicrobiota bacterium]MDP6789553.1 hypothetical protein [Candidatus Neomarinimicrobiota bacterium]MDP7071892.1 hypothetical protein [Candidatus Neomarinimicrobiota bacterium]
MRLFGFGFIASMGAAGLAGFMFSEFRTDIFFGWLGPAAAGTGSTLFLLQAAKKGQRAVTKSIQNGFIIKMVYYGVYITAVFKLYGFEPVPFMCSFLGFFLVLHTLEAIIIKDLVN